MDKKILVFGSEGQVGSELTQLLQARQCNYIPLDRSRLDLIQADHVYQMIKQIKPDIIINCAAYTAVDKAESEVELAMAINCDAPRMMAIAAQEIDSYLIHISTDYVFDGQNHTPYQEEDETNPVSVYGQSKLAGEQAIINNCHKQVIIRTAWVYGHYGKGNFVKTMLKLAKTREELKVVCDQIGSPTWTKDLAQALMQISHNLSPEQAGIYHYTNSGVCSWYDLAIATITEARQLGYSLQVKNILPIPTTDYPTPAQRPSYSVLSCQKISQLLGQTPPHWQASLRSMLQAMPKDII